MASSVIQAVCALHLCARAPHDVPQTAALTVGVRLTVERSTTPAVMVPRARSEAQAIWNAYGVALRWSDDQSADARLHLDVIVDRGGATHDSAYPELGHTTLDCGGVPHGPIRISMGAIEETIGAAPTLDPVLRDRQRAIAIGRVLAHEIGHALLGAPSYHDSEGLMRASFGAVDLTGVDRRRLRLSARSVSRLRARVAVLGEPVVAARCR